MLRRKLIVEQKHNMHTQKIEQIYVSCTMQIVLETYMHVAATLPCPKENTHSPWKELEITGGGGREGRGGNLKDKNLKRK